MQISDHFSLEEIQCRCGCGAKHIQQELLDKLEALRKEINKPINIHCAVRCIKHNQEVGGVTSSYHLMGKAADISVDGMDNEELFKAAEGIFNGRGLYSWGIHVDVRDCPATWDYR